MRKLFKALMAALKAIFAAFGSIFGGSATSAPSEDAADEAVENQEEQRDVEREQLRQQRRSETSLLIVGYNLRCYARAMLAGDMKSASRAQAGMPPEWRAWAAGLDARQMRILAAERGPALAAHLSGRTPIEGLTGLDEQPSSEFARRLAERQRAREMGRLVASRATQSRHHTTA